MGLDYDQLVKLGKFENPNLKIRFSNPPIYGLHVHTTTIKFLLIVTKWFKLQTYQASLQFTRKPQSCQQVPITVRNAGGLILRTV